MLANSQRLWAWGRERGVGERSREAGTSVAVWQTRQSNIPKPGNVMAASFGRWLVGPARVIAARMGKEDGVLCHFAGLTRDFVRAIFS